MVNGENYSGSEVVANPTLEGGEATLNSLEIDAIKYALGGGGGGGVSISNIFTNPNLTSYSTYELLDSVDNYDLIMIECYFGVSGNYVTTSNIFNVDYLKYRNEGTGSITHYIQLQCWEGFTLFLMNNPSSQGGAGDKIDYISDGGVRGIIKNIYGIKYNTN